VQERGLILGLVVVAIAAGGVAIAAPHLEHPKHPLTPAERARVMGAIANAEPGATVVRASCGRIQGAPGCSAVLRKPGVAACQDWLANIEPGVSQITPVGEGDSC